MKNSYVASQSFDKDRAAQLALAWDVTAKVEGDQLVLAAHEGHAQVGVVDDFCSLIQSQDVNDIRRVTRALLHAIHSVFPPPATSGHSGGDPISMKKLLEGEGLWETRKEILDGSLTGQRAA